MCLQYCHVNQWILDNDMPCYTCDRSPCTWDRTCITCRHLRIFVRIRYTIPSPDIHAPEPTYTVPSPWKIESCAVDSATSLVFHTLRFSYTDESRSDDLVMHLSLHSDHPIDLDPNTITPPPVMNNLRTTLSWSIPPTEWGWCSLTSWTIPPTYTCCHHDVPIVHRPIHRDTIPLAPWHHDHIDNIDMWLTLRGWTAEQPIRISNQDFSRPRYYGIPSPEWDSIETGTRPEIDMIYTQLMRILHQKSIDPSVIPLIQKFADDLGNPDLQRIINIIMKRSHPNTAPSL